MDMIITLVLIMILSYTKVKDTTYTPNQIAVMQNVTQLEICNNIMMERELEPFEKIVKELGLKC